MIYLSRLHALGFGPIHFALASPLSDTPRVVLELAEEELSRSLVQLLKRAGHLSLNPKGKLVIPEQMVAEAFQITSATTTEGLRDLLSSEAENNYLGQNPPPSIDREMFCLLTAFAVGPALEEQTLRELRYQGQRWLMELAAHSYAAIYRSKALCAKYHLQQPPDGQHRFSRFYIAPEDIDSVLSPF